MTHNDRRSLTSIAKLIFMYWAAGVLIWGAYLIAGQGPVSWWLSLLLCMIGTIVAIVGTMMYRQDR